MEKGCAYLNNRCETANSYYVDPRGHVTFQRMSPNIRQIWRSYMSSMSDYKFARLDNEGAPRFHDPNCRGSSLIRQSIPSEPPT